MPTHTEPVVRPFRPEEDLAALVALHNTVELAEGREASVAVEQMEKAVTRPNVYRGVSKSPDIGIIEGMSTCPHCQLEDQQVKAGVNPSGSQRYKCKVCDRRYTAEPHEIGYPQAVRDQAVRLYVDGLNFRRIARTLDVNHQSVINWVNAHVAGLPDTPPLAEGRPEVVELDELFTFVGEKRDKPS